MLFAHVGGVPVEELLFPAVYAAAAFGLAVRTYAARVSRWARRRPPAEDRS